MSLDSTTLHYRIHNHDETIRAVCIVLISFDIKLTVICLAVLSIVSGSVPDSFGLAKSILAM